ncbi:relaxase/mobilization nuclease domain-containing protein [Streptomyces sp. NPDC013157]|uniref:relaxase/mobilization nuclease domain-containing protein n=1 Tax=Streptomyces sp. NPDC013157 TaxID=3364861 RepID=UPI00367B2BAA
MIANIVKPGSYTRGVLRYLFGPGTATVHTDQHIVASWDGFAPDPGPEDSPGHTERMDQLVKALDLRVKQAGDHAPDGHVWHCSLRAAPEDRILTDAEWAQVARRIVHATGIALDGDPDGCRWIAVRHADDHIHIVATKVRGDLRPPRNWNDYHRAMTELTCIEEELGLTRIPRGRQAAAETPAAKRSTRAEQEKAKRTGRTTTVREELRHIVRTALTRAEDLDEFFNLLADAGLQVESRTLPSGDLQGYKVALPGDTNANGEPVFYSGSSLATDLSLPKIRQRLATAEVTAMEASTTGRRPNPWHQAATCTERIPHHIDHSPAAIAQAHLAAFGEVLYALPLYAPARLKAELRRAAVAFEHAAHTRARVDHQHTRALRGAIKAMRHQPTDGSGLAMLLDAAILVVTAVQRRGALHHHDRQVAAARQALVHLQAAYNQTFPEPLAALARLKPPANTVRRYAQHVRDAVPVHAEQILVESAWEALAATLAAAEAAGHDPAELLHHAAGQRLLDDATTSPARTLTWRIQRLGDRHAPSSQARAARARSSRITHVPPNARAIAGTTPTSTAVPSRTHRSR